MKFNTKKVFNKHLYSVISIVVTLVIIFSNVTLASAATRAVVPEPDSGGSSNPTNANIIDPFRDFYERRATQSEVVYWLEPPKEGYSVRFTENSMSGGYTSPIYSISGTNSSTVQLGPRYLYNNGQQIDGYKYDITIDLFSNKNFINIILLDSTCTLEFEFDLSFNAINAGLATFSAPNNVVYFVRYYDSSFNYLGSETSSSVSNDGWHYRGVCFINKPSKAVYASISVGLNGLEVFNNSFLQSQFTISNAWGIVTTLPNRPTPVSIFDVNDGSGYVDGKQLYLVDNDNEIGSVRLQSAVPGYELKYGNDFNSITFDGVVGDTGNYNINWRMFQPSKYLKIDPIVTGSDFLVDFEFTVDTSYDFYYPNIQVAIYYYESDFTPIDGATQRDYVGRSYEFIGDNKGKVESLFTIEIPDNAEYLAVSVIMQSFRLYGNTETVPVTISLDDYYIGVSIENYTYYYGQYLLDSVDRLDQLGGNLVVDKPDLDSIDTSIDNFIDRNTLLAYTSVFSVFWRSETLTTIVFCVFTLTLISFVVFGKK